MESTTSFVRFGLSQTFVEVFVLLAPLLQHFQGNLLAGAEAGGVFLESFTLGAFKLKRTKFYLVGLQKTATTALTTFKQSPISRTSVLCSLHRDFSVASNELCQSLSTRSEGGNTIWISSEVIALLCSSGTMNTLCSVFRIFT